MGVWFLELGDWAVLEGTFPVCSFLKNISSAVDNDLHEQPVNLVGAWWNVTQMIPN